MTFSVSDVKFDFDSENKSTLSVGSNSSASGGTSSAYLSTGQKKHVWTSPTSVEGSTPTWTEGTPSFTESSSSGDVGNVIFPSASHVRMQATVVVKLKKFYILVI